MNINSIITEWTYRLEKGYPDCDEDYIELRNVLREQTNLSELEQDAIVHRAMGLTEQDDLPLRNSNPNSKQDDIADLLTSIKQQTKQQQLESFAIYTAKHYQQPWLKKLTGDSGVFTINDIIDNEYFDVDIKQFKNSGQAIEAVLFKYMSSITGDYFERVDRPGVDGVSDSAEFEVKSTESSSFNIQLQTTFFSNNADKYYLFVFRDGSGYDFNNFKVYVISSQLLRKISLGNEIYNEIEKSGSSELLKQQIKDGLNNLNFDEQIAAVITSGQTGEYQKQFRIGNNVSVRFLIFIEPKKF